MRPQLGRAASWDISVSVGRSRGLLPDSSFAERAQESMASVFKMVEPE